LDTALTTSLDTSSVYSLGAPLSDPLGVLAGSLHIPNSSTIRFLAGEKKFRMSSSLTNATDEVASYAEASYFAEGLLETKQETIVSTRVPTIMTNTVGEERTVVSDSTSVDTSTQVIERDPIPSLPADVPADESVPQALVICQKVGFDSIGIQVTNFNSVIDAGNYKKFGGRWYVGTATGWQPWHYGPSDQLVYNPITQVYNLV
jgi:hypothetical protein